MSRPSLSYAIWLSANMWSPNLASSSPDMKCDLPSLAGQIGTGAQRGSVRCLRQPGISTRADADADAHTRNAHAHAHAEAASPRRRRRWQEWLPMPSQRPK
ncbi:hypothetical protein PMIN05_006940 [Paraphaeosphaeria minitans]